MRSRQRSSICQRMRRRSTRGLQRIADTLDAVPFVTMCNLANLNAAMRGGLLDLIEVNLIASVLARRSTSDATAFLATFEP